MLKKLIGWLLALGMMAVLCCQPAVADEEAVVFISGDYEYSLTDDGTAEITDYLGSDETLVVPAELDGIAVTSIGDMAFFWCNSLASITIPKGVTSIGNYAFIWCKSLTSINLPDTVTHIGINPFIDCDSLIRINVSPDNPELAVIDGVLFSKTDKALVCYPCARPNSEYTIPQGITRIRDRAVSTCAFLVSITIPDSVISIEDRAFYSCSSLTSITIPDSVTEIGANPFSSCSSLTSIRVSPGHPELAVIDGVLFSKSDKRLICYPCAIPSSEYTVPYGVECIGYEAFAKCERLTSITIPDSVTSIGDRAFNSCVSLTHFTLPNSVTSISDGMFMYCASMTNIMIPESVTSIGIEAFSFCESLTNLTIPDSVTEIGKYAFYSCPVLTLTVGRDSCAAQYAKENDIPYTFPDANGWLLD